MQDDDVPVPDRQRAAWNKGMRIGAKPPLQPARLVHQNQLQIEASKGDLTLFNMAIVAVPGRGHGTERHALDRVTVRRKKTGWPVGSEPTHQTRQAIVQNGSASGGPTAIPELRGVRPRSRPSLPLGRQIRSSHLLAPSGPSHRSIDQ